MISIFNTLDSKVDKVYGTEGNVVVFGRAGTIADSNSAPGGGGQAKQPLAVPGDIAVFGSGLNQGQTVDSGLMVNDSLGPSSSILWTSQKINTLLPSGPFLPLAGGTMSGNIVVPSGDLISIADAPALPSTAVNKAYVDAQVSVPNATPTVLGKIQLSGDLSGTATSPTIAPGSVTLPKMANLASSSRILGSSSSSSVVTSLTLDPTLSITGTTLKVASNTFLPLAGGTMAGNIIIPSGDLISIADAPLLPSTAVNKAYVDAQISSVPNATPTVLGKIQLAGDLSGTATSPAIAPNAVTLSKMANLAGTSQLLGSSSSSSAAADLTLGNSLNISGNVLSVVPTFNNTTLNGTVSGTAVLQVANGGTGDSSLTGFVIGNGTSPFTAITTIPVSNVSGAVESVNGVFPDITGNVSIILGSVQTGILADLPPVGPPLVSGDIYVVSGDPTPANNGTTFIYTTTPSNQWLLITPNLAATDARYLQLAGGTMAGNIIIPSGDLISIADAPLLPSTAVNKAYVDAQVSSVPNATPTVLGKIQLAGDLSGTATSPSIAPNAVTLSKMANLSGTSQLLGSSSSSSAATDLTLDPTLSITGTVLKVASNAFLPLAGGTMAGNIIIPSGDLISIADAPLLPSTAANKAYVDAQIASVPNATPTVLGKIQLAGDLSGTATLPTISPNAVTLSKMANLSGTSQLLGSSSSSSSPTDLTLDPTLSITGTTLKVASNTFLPLAGGTMAGNIVVPSGDLISIADAPLLPSTATNKAYVDAQIASVPNATPTVLGKIQLAGDLSGTATSPAIAPNAVTLSKMANLSGTSQLLGSSSSSSAATDLTLGSGLQISGSVISVNSATFSKTVNTAVRTFTTGTGATGFQVSATQPSNVYYSVQISTTVTIGGPGTGTVFLEVSPTNSATPASWITQGTASNGQTVTLAIVLQSVQTITMQLSAYVPPGYFVKLRTTSSGTTSFNFINGIEVIG